MFWWTAELIEQTANLTFDIKRLKNKKAVNAAKLTKKKQQILQEDTEANLYAISSLLWKETAIIWYSDSHSNNVWWIITFTFFLFFIYSGSIFCLLFKLNDFHIILHSTLQNQSNQHIWLISLFTVECHELLSLCLCGGAGLPCEPNQRCLTHQQWISVAVICSMRIMIIPLNAKQFLMKMKHWYTACSKTT